MKYSEKSTLGEVLKHKKGPEFLGKYHVPCLSCHMAASELDTLTLKFLGNAYGINIKGLLKDLNNSSLTTLTKKKQEPKKKKQKKK